MAAEEPSYPPTPSAHVQGASLSALLSADLSSGSGRDSEAEAWHSGLQLGERVGAAAAVLEALAPTRWAGQPAEAAPILIHDRQAAALRSPGLMRFMPVSDTGVPPALRRK